MLVKQFAANQNGSRRLKPAGILRISVRNRGKILEIRQQVDDKLSASCGIQWEPASFITAITSSAVDYNPLTCAQFQKSKVRHRKLSAKRFCRGGDLAGLENAAIDGNRLKNWAELSRRKQPKWEISAATVASH